MSCNQWKVMSLSEVPIEIIDGDRGKNYPKGSDFYKNGYCLFLNAKNVTINGFVFNEKKFINKQKDKKLRKGKLRRNDVVLTTRGTVGNVAYYSCDIPYSNLRINSGMVILRCDETKIDSKFLYWLFKSPNIQKQITSLCTGSAQPHLPISILKDIKMPIPKMNEQKAIASILSALDDKIKLNNRINKNLEEMAQVIFKNWCVDFEPFKDGEFVNSELGRIPKGWRVGILGDLITIASGKRPKIKVAEKNINNSVEIIGASGVMGYTSSVLINKKILTTGRVGTHGIIQRINYPCWVSDNAFIIQSNNFEYAYQLLKAIDYKSLNRGSTQPLITQTDLKNQQIIIPNNEVLNDFENKITLLFTMQYKNEQENQHLAQMRDALLPKLMSGEIRVPVEKK